MLPVLAALGTRGAALAATGDEEVVFLLHAENAEIVDQVLEIAFRAIEEKIGMPGVLADPARYEREAAVWNLGDEFSIAQRGGLHGTPPDLTKLVEGDVPFTTDFRAVYTTLAKNWMGLHPSTAHAGLDLIL